MSTDTMFDNLPTSEEMQDVLHHRMVGVDPWVFVNAARWVIRYDRNHVIRNFDPTVSFNQHQGATLWQQCGLLYRATGVAPKDLGAIARAFSVTRDADDRDLLILMEIVRTGIHPNTILDATDNGFDLSTVYTTLVAYGPYMFSRLVAAGLAPAEVHSFAIKNRAAITVLNALKGSTVYPVSCSHIPRVGGL